MVKKLENGLKEALWHGWPHWYCVALGGYDPKIIELDWSLVQLWDTFYDLRIKRLLEA